MVFTSINQTKIAQFKKMCMWDAGTHCCPIRVTINKFDTWLSFLPVYQSFRINGLPQCIPRAVNCKQIFAIQSPAPRVDCIAFYHEGKNFPSAHKYREILYNRGSPLYKSVSKAGVAFDQASFKIPAPKKVWVVLRGCRKWPKLTTGCNICLRLLLSQMLFHIQRETHIL